jgi:hypothetical protein
MRRLFGSLLVVAAIGSAGTAWATPTFPDVVQTSLSLTYSPPCSICHAGGLTQRGTVSTPLGRSLRARGLAAYDEASLRAALAALAANRVDSDGDGNVDVDELIAGDDPNRSSRPGGISDSAGELVPPEYGCSVAGPSRFSRPPGPIALAVALGASLCLRRRPAHRQRRDEGRS